MSKKTTKRALKKQRATTPAWIWIVAGVAVLAIIILVFAPGTPKGNMSAEISVEKASQLRDEGAFFLDVREQSEWDQFHIPGATLIPLGSLSQQLDMVPKDKVVVVVCRTGNRSAEGRDILLKAGFMDVTSMAGGVTEWQNKGFPIETGR